MMRLRLAIIPTATALGVALAMASTPANASTILTNGSFELPGGEVRDALTAAYLPGWTYVSNDSLDIYEADDQGDGLAAADGSHYVSFGHNGTVGGSISQIFVTTPGTLYTLNYQVAEQQGDDPLQVLRATVDGVSVDNSGLSLGFLPGVKIYFTGTGSDTVEFLDATPTGDGAGSNLALDAVSISRGVGSVPEPASWAMMLLGMGAIGGALRRRTSATLLHA